MLQSSCSYLFKVLLQKDECGYAKVIHEKRKKRKKKEKSIVKKWTSVQENKTMGTLMSF
jgi:hypothetical protein